MPNNSQNYAIRKISTPKLVFLSIITLGIYWYIWLWKLISDINNLYPKKYIHRYGWFATLIFLEIAAFYMKFNGMQANHIFNSAEILNYVCQLVLALQILKNIESYVKHKFSITIKHNVFGWLFFGCFYINFSINRLSSKIKSDLEKQILDLKN